MKDTNAIGNIGENCASLRLSKFCIFTPYLMGGKTPVFDILLEIIDEVKPYYALVQVKATDSKTPLDSTGNMKTPVPKDKLYKLIERVLPTYVAGIDINSERMHIAPAFDPAVTYNAIPPILVIDNIHPTNDEASLQKLKEDIINYWESYQMHINKSHYKSLL